MCGSAVGTGGGPEDDAPEDEGVDAVAGEPRRDADGAGADELTGGSELAVAADDEVTGALGSELAAAVGPATCADVEVHALSPNPAAMTTAAARHPVRFTHPVCRFG